MYNFVLTHTCQKILGLKMFDTRPGTPSILKHMELHNRPEALVGLTGPIVLGAAQNSTVLGAAVHAVDLGNLPPRFFHKRGGWWTSLQL